MVAVKSLKDGAGDEEIRALTNEIQMMKDIPHHPMLVNIIGAVTAPGLHKPYLITEFCSLGDLR